ncbi:LytTR family DNA-binding domain-containing protein [Pseudoduganella sp. SL102]|uniref:LytR/AlgR family response regulator transcription factor n=1 Tax=Pseudoduganella sp. SL102 TaxID=2995154 RepID=UPI00248B14A4|nr:LytTR family DNA-binding domain-containing protein [Pseudoduganella sp. SL102]WBS04390.1 LytTR family DNA-binding domain-containing protein [Pseudoduganella sp. SL102]
MTIRPRVLIADDEPLLRGALREQLEQLWPEAELVGEAADGYEALRLARELAPDLAFLDIRMPGLSGLEVARTFGGRTHVVFVTAYDEHAVEAFDQGALDYVLKPVEPVRLARTVARVRERIAHPPPDLAQLAQRLQPAAAPSWIQASVGQTIHFIDLHDIVYFSAEAKYTRVVTDRLEAHIRTPLKELADMLGEAGFWQVHRGYVVAVRRIAAAMRDADGAMWLTLRDHPARLPVSQRFQARFRGM